jgi:hypothetical protein
MQKPLSQMAQLTIRIYVGIGDPEHLKVFADQAAADAWFKAHEVLHSNMRFCSELRIGRRLIVYWPPF